MRPRAPAPAADPRPAGRRAPLTLPSPPLHVPQEGRFPRRGEARNPDSPVVPRSAPKRPRCGRGREVHAGCRSGSLSARAFYVGWGQGVFRIALPPPPPEGRKSKDPRVVQNRTGSVTGTRERARRRRRLERSAPAHAAAVAGSGEPHAPAPPPPGAPRGARGRTPPAP